MALSVFLGFAGDGGKQVVFSSSFRLATMLKSSGSCRAAGAKGFSFPGGTNPLVFVLPGFAFCPCAKKAKDSGGGTPDSSGWGSIPCEVFAFFNLLLSQGIVKQGNLGTLSFTAIIN